MHEMEPVLEVEPRMPGKHLRKAVRAADKVPAILYGEGIPSQPLAASRREAERLLASEHPLVRLRLGAHGQNEDRLVMIREVQRHPIDGQLLHLDFFQVKLTEKITAQVPVLVHGEEALVKQNLVIEHHLREVEVECLPTDLPPHVDVDVSHLKAGQHCAAGDLSLSPLVTLLTDPESVIVTVEEPRAHEAEEPAAERTEPEVIAKGKAAEAEAET